MLRTVTLPGELAFALHGGALDAARSHFPEAPTPWLDLSTGINPTPYPLPPLSAEAWTRLPDAAALAALEAVAAHRYGIASGSVIVAAPGSQTLIQHLPTLCDGADVRLLAPIYCEFEAAFGQAGRQVRGVPHVEALRGADVAILVNPNNPDGRLIEARDLAALAPHVGTLVIDEAFMDLVAEGPGATSTASDRTIVLRSFGKTYGLAGLRLGFAILAPRRAAQLRRLLGPWPVSGPALAIGAAALRDEAWIATMRERLTADARRLGFLMRNAGTTQIGGTALFTLVAHPAASRLFAHLARGGILTRPFANEPTWLRIGLPGREADWVRLEAALRSFD